MVSERWMRGTTEYRSAMDCSILCLLFFFFQAEDGIRDSPVTGVQTCALPILYVNTARLYVCGYSIYLSPGPRLNSSNMLPSGFER